MCWGSYQSGQVGDGTLQGRFDPARLRPVYVLAVSGTGRLTGVVDVALGSQRSCARLGSGGARCWGSGPVGDGTTTAAQPRPRAVRNVGNTASLAGVSSLAVGGAHTCAVTGPGAAVVCWGKNASRQLADLTTTKRLTPVPALGA